MKCPRCGHEMVLDSHRRVELYMCYDCGYIEGRNTGTVPVKKHLTNFEQLCTLNLNEAAAFLAQGLGMNEEQLADWLDDTAE